MQLVGIDISRLSRPPLAIRVTLRGTGITYPRIPGKPFVRGAARRTKGTAEENRHRTKGRAISVHAGGKASPRLGAVDHHYAHLVLLKAFGWPLVGKLGKNIIYLRRY